MLVLTIKLILPGGTHVPTQLQVGRAGRLVKLKRFNNARLTSTTDDTSSDIFKLLSFSTL